MLRKSILSQYANSPKILSLIESFDSLIDPSKSIDDFYNYVFNISTATGFGLDVWGAILNLGRNIRLTIDGNTQVFTLTDDQYRLVLLIRAMANLTDCTFPSLNAILEQIFIDRGSVLAIAIPATVMKIRYVFSFLLSDFEKALLQALLVHPTGVGVEVFELPDTDTFGFNGSGLQTFNNGTFFQGASFYG